jgi:hypothetical protein
VVQRAALIVSAVVAVALIVVGCVTLAVPRGAEDVLSGIGYEPLPSGVAIGGPVTIASIVLVGVGLLLLAFSAGVAFARAHPARWTDRPRKR